MFKEGTKYIFSLPSSSKMCFIILIVGRSRSKLGDFMPMIKYNDNG